MEVAAKEAASATENQQVEDTPSFSFTWTIDNFSRLNIKEHCSEIFIVGGYKWRVLIYPKGDDEEHLSMFLDVADSGSLPNEWSIDAQFSLVVVNQVHSKYTIRNDTQHQFNSRESNWGFPLFLPLSDLYDPSRGYLVNDTVVVEAEVVVHKVVDYWTYDSKKETGYVGLKNQGATCYMNSLLQTLYHIPYFRKAVYHMPTTENDIPSGSIPLALQSLFFRLQYSDNSVATKELTKSFGWDTNDSFMQHDVQELNRVLCEKLEDKMKGTVAEGTIQQLFEGHLMNYIECINVDYESSRKESFYDLQLDVKGCRDVYASFDKYVEVVCLEGDNKYHAEHYGLQDAKKGALFIDFPPVLQLQLKRFEYDFVRDTMVKINDRYEFPLQLDLDRDNGKYLSPDADRSVRNLYALHSVLVHSGGVQGGHYCAFIRPILSDEWFKFDDECVTKVEMKRALEEQYGSEEELPQTNPGFNNTLVKYSNAYMLVYIRESDKDKIICCVDEKDIAEHFRIRLKKELEEKELKKKEKAEAHLFTIIKVARDEDLAGQIGKDIYFDLVDHDKVLNFRIKKQMLFKAFKEEVAKKLGIPVQFQRFWLWAERKNYTYRPNKPLSPLKEAQSLGQVSNKGHNAELKLFLEVEHGDSHPVSPPEKTKDDILLFFKLFDPVKEELRYVGRLFVKALGKPAEIITKLNEMAGFSPNEEIELYEEIMFEPSVMCEKIDKTLNFRSSQLEDGDIVCYQKCPHDSNDQCRYPDVPSYLEYVHNRQVVHFRSLEKPKEDDFCLELSKLHTYDDVVERVAHHLGLDDPSKIRLTSHNCYSQQPKPQPIKYHGVEHLSDMLVHYNQISDILFYEVLDIPLPELQGLKTLKIAFHNAMKDETVIHNIRLPKNSIVGDVINDLKSKVELSHPNAELRLLEIFYHKIYKIFPPHEKIENINDQCWTLRAEEIPEEEKNLGPHDRLIHVYHFMKDSNQNQMVQNFGEPFFLVIYDGETLAEVKLCIQKKLQIPDEEFSKWKFAFLSLGRPEYLQDSDVVSSRFQRRDVYGALDLGLEHSDITPKMACQVNQQYGEMETVGEGEDASSKFYFKWNDEMDACLTTTLIDQMEKEFKVVRSFTNVAYNATCHVLEEIFGTKFTIEHVKHRLKTLKKHLAAFQDMQNSTSGFSFNKVTKMIDAEPTVWDAYLKAHPNAEQYRCKPLSNFENLMIIFGKDRATTSQGSKTAKKLHVRLERELEVNIDDQDQKETSIEQNECSIGMQGDKMTASKLGYRSSTGKTYANSEFKIDGLREEFQMLKSRIDDIAINCYAPRMITEEQLFEEVNRIDGFSELSQIVAYDFLCGDATRGRTFIGLPLARRKQWLEFKFGQPLD